ncbi:EF_hand domain-containing protein [Hexamita inflata]|uniref:EF hand domain-containing protein n=1 Tax=Hexamita inflata TaxID=28002 RepID=A0AA86QIC6_9EUKA|nr:EF hand domain-containing protein [Hexamita inflata]CAI9956811.1 EF hand domain-containing protein [Hexamita inflata]
MSNVKTQVKKVIFNSIDQNKTGFITQTQLSDYVKQIFQDNHKEKAMKNILNQMDIDTPDVQINFDQFFQFMYILENADMDKLSSIYFYLTDTDYSGKISRKELRDILLKMKTPMEWAETLSESQMNAKADEDDQMTYSDFVDFFEQLIENAEEEEENENDE